MPSVFFITIPSRKQKISYTIVSLIMHDGKSLYFGHYVSDFLNDNTEMWWHCDDDEITELCDFPEGVYTRESHKNIDARLRQSNVNGLYHNKQPYIIQICF